MAMSIKYLLLVSFLLATIISCKKEIPEPLSSPSSPVFTFIQPGHEWQYRRIMETIDTINISLRVLGNSGEEYAAKLSSWTFPGFWPWWYDGFPADTLRWRKTGTEWAVLDSSGNPFTIITANPVLNETYTFIIPSTGDTVIRKVVNLSESVTVPAGTFTCIKVLEAYYWHPYPVSYSEYYINKDVGIVKTFASGTYNYINELTYKNF